MHRHPQFGKTAILISFLIKVEIPFWHWWQFCMDITYSVGSKNALAIAPQAKDWLSHRIAAIPWGTTHRQTQYSAWMPSSPSSCSSQPHTPRNNMDNLVSGLLITFCFLTYIAQMATTHIEHRRCFMCVVAIWTVYEAASVPQAPHVSKQTTTF